jgi:hypothetical protein
MPNTPARRHPLTAFSLTIVVGALACSSNDRPPPADDGDNLDLTDLSQYDGRSGDARDIFATGGCTDGETQVCRIYLPSHNDIQPCFVGEQLCADSAWGECGNAVLVDANNEDAELDQDELTAP